MVPKLLSLGWMRPSRRVRPRDGAVPRGTTHPNTPPRAQGDTAGWPQQRGDGGTHHMGHLFQGPCVGPGKPRTKHHWWDGTSLGLPATRTQAGLGGSRGCPHGGGSATKPRSPFLTSRAGLGHRMWHGWGTNWVVAASHRGPRRARGAGEGRKWLHCGPRRQRQSTETGSCFLPGRGDQCCGRCGAGRGVWVWVGDVGKGSS